MKRAIKATILTLAFILALVIPTHNTPDTSLATWRHVSGYNGPVCTVVVDQNNRPHCSNGAPYNPATVNAEEGYELWATCVQYPDAPVCKSLDN